MWLGHTPLLPHTHTYTHTQPELDELARNKSERWIPTTGKTSRNNILTYSRLRKKVWTLIICILLISVSAVLREGKPNNNWNMIWYKPRIETKTNKQKRLPACPSLVSATPTYITATLCVHFFRATKKCGQLPVSFRGYVVRSYGRDVRKGWKLVPEEWLQTKEVDVPIFPSGPALVWYPFIAGLLP